MPKTFHWDCRLVVNGGTARTPNAQQLPDGYEADREWSSKYLRLCMYGGDVPDVEVYKERDAFSDVIQ